MRREWSENGASWTTFAGSACTCSRRISSSAAPSGRPRRALLPQCQHPTRRQHRERIRHHRTVLIRQTQPHPPLASLRLPAMRRMRRAPPPRQTVIFQAALPRRRTLRQRQRRCQDPSHPHLHHRLRHLHHRKLRSSTDQRRRSSLSSATCAWKTRRRRLLNRKRRL